MEITGNKHHDTIGMIIKKADCIIRESKIHKHLMGGILIWADVKNKIKVINSKIIYNSKAGIHIVGNDSNALVEGNKIENNHGAVIFIQFQINFIKINLREGGGGDLINFKFVNI